MAATDAKIEGICRLFGHSPRQIILEFLLKNKGLDFGIGDIAKETKLNRATAYNTMAELIDEKIVIPGRSIGNTQMYVLNSGKIKMIIELKQEKQIDKKRMDEASKIMDEIREAGIFSFEGDSTEVIRKWRDKRR